MFSLDSENQNNRIDGAATASIMSVAAFFDFLSFIISAVGWTPVFFTTAVTTAIGWIPGLGTLASLIGTALSLLLGSAFWALNIILFLIGGFYIFFLLRARGVQVFSKRLSWAAWGTILAEFLPIVGILPSFSISTAWIISATRKEDRRRREQESDV